MNTDIRLKAGYFNHPKIRKLKKILGPEAVLAHIELLLWVGTTRPYYRDGILRDFDPQDVAQAAGWRGDPDEFTNTLLELKLLDNGQAGYEIHNWTIHNYYCTGFDARSKSARRSANISWLIRRGYIKNSKQIPPSIDLTQPLDDIILQIQQPNAKRKAERKAACNANASNPTSTSTSTSKVEGGESAKDPPLGGEDPPPPFTQKEIQAQREDIDNENLNPEIRASFHRALDRRIKDREERYHEHQRANL